MSKETGSALDRSVAFGPFRLFPERRVLLEDGKRLRLGSRAVEILAALVERPGVLITKEELVARVWPNTVVEEGNLRVHMAALRRTLGDDQGGHQYITTVPGRGYRFVAASVASHRTLPTQLIAEDRAENNLPAPLARMVGRADVVATIVQQCRNDVSSQSPGLGVSARRP